MVYSAALILSGWGLPASQALQRSSCLHLTVTPCEVAAGLRTRTYRTRRYAYLAPAERCTHARRRRQCICAAERSPWEVLGVKQGQDAELKKAYKAKARKLHPDVNKAADASARFMECRQAYITLTDPRLRAEYDRKSRGASSSGGWDVWSQPDKVRQATEEVFYGFTEFFKDLDNDLKDRRQRRDQKPRSLWEELSDIGEEFVEFLEGAARSNQPESNNAKAKEEKQQREKQAAQTRENARQTAQEAAAKAEADAARARQEADTEIEQMLADMKRNISK